MAAAKRCKHAAVNTVYTANINGNLTVMLAGDVNVSFLLLIPLILLILNLNLKPEPSNSRQKINFFRICFSFPEIWQNILCQTIICSGCHVKVFWCTLLSPPVDYLCSVSISVSNLICSALMLLSSPLWRHITKRTPIADTSSITKACWISGKNAAHLLK